MHAKNWVYIFRDKNVLFAWIYRCRGEFDCSDRVEGPLFCRVPMSRSLFSANAAFLSTKTTHKFFFFFFIDNFLVLKIFYCTNCFDFYQFFSLKKIIIFLFEFGCPMAVYIYNFSLILLDNIIGYIYICTTICHHRVYTFSRSWLVSIYQRRRPCSCVYTEFSGYIHPSFEQTENRMLTSDNPCNLFFFFGGQSTSYTLGIHIYTLRNLSQFDCLPNLYFCEFWIFFFPFLFFFGPRKVRQLVISYGIFYIHRVIPPSIIKERKNCK